MIKWGVRGNSYHGRGLPYHAGWRVIVRVGHGALMETRGCVGSGENPLLSLRGSIKHETGVSWRKIKAEYIAGGISQRALAEKHGVALTTLVKHAKKEKWTEKRKAAEIKTVEKVSEKTAEAVADNAVLLEKAKTGLLKLAVGMIEAYPDVKAAEVKKKQGGAFLKYSLKDIAAVLSVLEDKTQKGQSADIEDLSPLVDLLK